MWSSPLPGHFPPGRAGNITWYLSLASPRPCLPADTSPGNPPPPPPHQPCTQSSKWGLHYSSNYRPHWSSGKGWSWNL